VAVLVEDGADDCPRPGSACRPDRTAVIEAALQGDMSRELGDAVGPVPPTAADRHRRHGPSLGGGGQPAGPARCGQGAQGEFSRTRSSSSASALRRASPRCSTTRASPASTTTARARWTARAHRLSGHGTGQRRAAEFGAQAHRAVVAAARAGHARADRPCPSNCARGGLVHRDVKPGNILITPPDR